MYGTVLIHHGIDGQRWGKRNGPPYPLDAKSHSAAEKKAGTDGWTKEAKKDLKSMSNAELTKAIARKELENRYHELASNTGKVKKFNDSVELTSKGLSAVADVGNVVNSGMKAAYDASPNDKKTSTLGQDISKVSSKSARLLSDTTKGIKKKDNTNLSRMSDKELKKAVDRLVLETRYEDLHGANNEKNRQRVNDILTVLGLATSIASIAVPMTMAIIKK